MKRPLSYILALFTLPFAPLGAQTLLPKPQQAVMQKGSFRIDKPFRIDNAAGNAALNFYDVLQPAAARMPHASTHRYVRYQFDKSLPSAEAYRLQVSADSILITAKGHEGFMRAAQTLNQLVTRRGITCCTVTDSPAFAWRGVMIDVSRHFFSIDFLKKQIDALARYKINRLHLHLTDAAGWRMEIKRYPLLTSLAAWRTDSLWKIWWNNGQRHYAAEGTPGAYGGYYTQDELRALNDYAQQRGITLVPEIEMPAHSEEVLTAYPELSCTHEPYKQADFCPGNEATYTFLENVLTEVMEVFPSTYIHVGGDEAGKASWPKCPRCQALMQKLGIDHVDGLQTYLINRMGKFLQSHGRQMLGWDEIIADSLPQGTAVMVWRGTDKAGEAIRKGCDVVLSPGAYCYLDSYQDAPPTQPEAIGGYLPLQKVYAYDPLQNLTPDECKRVKGVQGNLWTEYVPTPEQAEYMLYPRVLALAEIGWNGTGQKDYADFRQRAEREVDVLQRKGIHAFDLKNERGERPEALQPVKHKAVGAKVQYNLPAHPYYLAGGDGALTDGLRGGWANNDGRWQGFIKGKRFDVVVDLGSVQSVSRVACDFMQSCGPEIFFPSAFIVSVSADGQQFTEVARTSYESAKTVLPDVRTCSWKGTATEARYVRVQAEPSAFGGWVFTDEVVIE